MFAEETIGTTDSRSKPSGIIGLLAGNGLLPIRVAEVAKARGCRVVVVDFGHQKRDSFPEDVEYQQARLGQAAGVMRQLADRGVRDIVMAGALKRPSLSELKPDLATAQLAMRLFSASFGDDSLLRALIHQIEKMGFRVVSAGDFLPALASPSGVLGQVKPDMQAKRDIQRGLEVARQLGRLDIGQAVVVQQGVVLGVEAAEGTTGLLERCALLHRQGRGGVLVKIVKPGQDERADLPVIGPDTLRAARRAGLCGIAIEAGGCLILERQQVIEMADAGNLFLIGIDVQTDDRQKKEKDGSCFAPVPDLL